MMGTGPNAALGSALSLILALTLTSARGGCSGSGEEASSTLSASERTYVWDLSALFADHAAWEAERDALLERIESIGELARTTATSSSHLADKLNAAYALRARATRLAIYGFLTSETDTTSERGRLYYDVGTALEHGALAAVAFLRQEISALQAATLQQWIEHEPRLARHRRWINQILRNAPHTLGPQADAILESAARWPRLAADLFGPLHSADAGWRQIRLVSGEEVTANRSTYLRLRSSPVWEDRRSVVKAFFGHLAELEELFGLLYTRRIEAAVTCSPV